MEKKVLDNEYMHYELIDGILICTYQSGLEITLDVAKNIVRNRLNFTENKSYPVLLNDKGLVSVDKSAREYFASEEGIKGVTAAALVANTVFNTFLGNFFIKVTVIKPPVPTRLFTNEVKAIKWLEQFKEK